MFDPGNDGIVVDHEDYELTILMKHHQFFGPFPTSYSEFADQDAIKIIIYAMDSLPREKAKPFQCITEREMTKEDNAFLFKIMKLDPRDRPTAREILQDEWFERS